MNAQDWLKTAKTRIDPLDARLLLQHVTNWRHSDLICRLEEPLPHEILPSLNQLLERRALGEPLDYLTGETRFLGYRFKVSPDVLTPRPETEELIHLALEKLVEQTEKRQLKILKVLDLGTGSGIIPISLALEYERFLNSGKPLPSPAPPALCLTAVDISPAALKIAEENGKALNVAVCWQESDWFSTLSGKIFHLIAANPPYIAGDDPHLKHDGLLFEPRLALTDEADGLSAFRAIIRLAPLHLEAGGWLLFEHGYEQGGSIRALLKSAGFSAPQTWKDLSGHERFTGGAWQAKTCEMP